MTGAVLFIREASGLTIDVMVLMAEVIHVTIAVAGFITEVLCLMKDHVM